MTRRRVYSARKILKYFVDKGQVKTSTLQREIGVGIKDYLFVMKGLGLLEKPYHGYYKITPSGLRLLSELEDNVEFALLAEAQRH